MRYPPPLRSLLFAMALAPVLSSARGAESPRAPKVQFASDAAGTALRILIEGKEALVFRCGPNEDLAHYWPVRSPSGKSMTVQHPTAKQQFPHHRSFWFGDTVQLAGKRKASFYSPYYSRKAGQEKPGYPDRVRHVKFLEKACKGRTGKLRSALVWEMDFTTPVLDETRELIVVALGGGAYFLDITFTITAAHGDVAFLSDWVHYAWPYIRMNETFNVQHGGTIVDSAGRVNQKATNGQVADWVDYSNRVEGKTEGLAIFSHPSNPRPHKWLTRDYGCFGPRRADAKSGKRFTLKKEERLQQRVGILVHTGDVKEGKVAERFRMYARGEVR